MNRYTHLQFIVVVLWQNRPQILMTHLAGLYFLSNTMFSIMRMSSKLNISSVFDKQSKVASRGWCVMLYFLSQPSSDKTSGLFWIHLYCFHPWHKLLAIKKKEISPSMHPSLTSCFNIVNKAGYLCRFHN